MSKLPTGSRRVAALVENSVPNGKRPRISTEFEVQLGDTDRKLAGCYASMEDLEDRLDALAERLDSAESDGVVIATDAQDDISIVRHVVDLADEVREASTRLLALTVKSSK